MGTPKSTSFRETTSFDVFIVKIDADAWLNGVGRTSKETLAQSLSAHFSVFGPGWGEKGQSYRDKIVHRGKGPDIITHANFVTIGLEVLGIAGVEFPTFPLTCVVDLKTLWHYRV